MTVYFRLEPGAFSNQEIIEEFKQLLEKYKEIKREHNAHEVPYNPYSGTNQPEFFFSADISFMRKIKMSKLEGNKDFDDIFRCLFNQEKVKFIKDITFAGTSGLDGTSGSSGASGTSGSSGASGLLGEPFDDEKYKRERLQVIKQYEDDCELLEEILQGKLIYEV